MKRIMPFAAASNARPETILSLQQRLAFLCQIERELERRSAVLDACRGEVISTDRTPLDAPQTRRFGTRAEATADSLP